MSLQEHGGFWKKQERRSFNDIPETQSWTTSNIHFQCYLFVKAHSPNHVPLGSGKPPTHKGQFQRSDVAVKITAARATVTAFSLACLPVSNWPLTSPLCPPSTCLSFLWAWAPALEVSFPLFLGRNLSFSPHPSSSPEPEMLPNVAAHYSLCLLDFNFPLCSSKFQLSSTTPSVTST